MTDRSPARWQVAVRRAWHGFMRHRGIDAAAALTFFSLLAMLPGALAVVSVFAIFDDRERAVSDLVAVVDIVLPNSAATDLEEVLRELLSLGNPVPRPRDRDRPACSGRSRATPTAFGRADERDL